MFSFFQVKLGLFVAPTTTTVRPRSDNSKFLYLFQKLAISSAATVETLGTTGSWSSLVNASHQKIACFEKQFFNLIL